MSLQGGKCCIIGDSKSFFTLFRVVLEGGGGKVSHFDRDGRLQAALNSGGSGGGSRAELLAEAVQRACASAEGGGCLLADAELVAGGGVPLGTVQQVVVYASEMDSPWQAALQEQLAQLTCPLHRLEVALPAQLAPPVAAPACPAAAAPTAAVAGPAGGGGRVLHAARQEAAEVPGSSPAGMEWPVIVSSDPSRPIRWGHLQHCLLCNAL